MVDRAVTYARVSGNDRSKGGRNLAGQLEMGREYSQDHGYAIVAELAEDDRGASGASFELEQLGKIFEMARNREFNVLVVREIDRLSRNLAKQLIVEEELKKYGVRIEYVLGEYSDTPEGNFMKNIRATVAEYERLKITERNVRGRVRKVKAGSVMTHGQAPYGYRLIQNGSLWALRIDKEEADIVRFIFDLYTQGDGERPPLAIFGITKKLTSMKIPTYMDKKEIADGLGNKKTRHGKKRRKFGEWSMGSVHHILTNETYTGIWHYGKYKQNTDGLRYKNKKSKMLSVDVPAIISQEQWSEVQKRLVHNRENARRNQKHKYLMSKRLICGECGYKMGASPNYSGKRVYFYYTCNHSKTIGMYADQCTNTVTYSALKLDSQIWGWVKELLSNPEHVQQGLDEYRNTLEQENSPLLNRLNIIDTLLLDNQSKYERLLELYISGDFPKETLVDHKSRLEKTIEGLEIEQTSLSKQLNSGLTIEQEETIKDFTYQLGNGLSVADNQFKARRHIIELLDVTATLTRENGQKVAYVSCALGNIVFEINKKKVRNSNGAAGGGNLQIASSSIGMGGENRSLRWSKRDAESSSLTSADTT